MDSTPETPAGAFVEASLLADGYRVVHVGGRWRLGSSTPTAPAVDSEDWSGVRGLRFDSDTLADWDSTLIVFLLQLVDTAAAKGVEIDLAGLPPGARGLLDLARAVPEPRGTRRGERRRGFLERIGVVALSLLDQTRRVLAFVGEITQAFGDFLLGRARFRRGDFALYVQQSGAGALGIVSLISILVGLILAFVGSVQLALFGAQIYIADAVAIGMLREMGALMTAVIMAGRTGAAYAAQLGSMQVNEEIDALRTLGISPEVFLVLPRVLALVLMVPLLTLYANALGILGGLTVAIGLFDIPATQYLAQTEASIRLADLGVGLFMSLVFGVIIGMAGCYHGLRCGRSSAAVGEAATSAVVSAIVAIVVANSVITVVTTQLGI